MLFYPGFSILFIRVCKAPLTKPVCVVLALSSSIPPEQEDHWKAILGNGQLPHSGFTQP